MPFERKEFLNILVFANHMANMDGERHPAELKVLHALFKSIGVTDTERKLVSEKISLKTMLKEIESNEMREVLVDVLILVAAADGKFAKEEEEFIHRLMNHLRMNPQDHPFFKDGSLDLEQVRKRVKDIINLVKKLSHPD